MPLRVQYRCLNANQVYLLLLFLVETLLQLKRSCSDNAMSAQDA